MVGKVDFIIMCVWVKGLCSICGFLCSLYQSLQTHAVLTLSLLCAFIHSCSVMRVWTDHYPKNHSNNVQLCFEWPTAPFLHSVTTSCRSCRGLDGDENEKLKEFFLKTQFFRWKVLFKHTCSHAAH